MSAANQNPEEPAVATPETVRVTTLISGAGVRPLGGSGPTPANENRWFDRAGFRRRWIANIAAGLFTAALLYAGVWIVHEFVRLQKLEACYEAGRRDCMPLDMNRRGR